MRLGLGLNITANSRRGGTPAFSPSTLYSSGSQGIWLDPSDLSTMFSDRAGTVPITTPGTVVGKRLDKSGRGNHAVAPTDAARPIYGVEPKGGKRNLLTWSEGFDNAAWTKGSGSITATNIADPIGGNTAEAFTSSTSNAYLYNTESIAVQSGGTYAASLWMKVPSGTDTIVFSIINPAFGILQSVNCSVTSSWQRFTVSGSVGANTTAKLLIGGSNSIGSGEVLHLWGAQLELGSVATEYQRVTTAYDVTESGVPTCHYVQYDGSDDSMSTSAIDFTGTDKMSVFAGVRKLSDATGIIAELSAIVTSNAGSFLLYNNAAQIQFGSRGSAVLVEAVASSLTAPISRIVTGLADIAGDRATIRLNGTQVAQSTADQGTGNFSNYPLFIGRRNNATLPFNGRDYGIIVVGKAASAGEITDTETWLAAKTAQVVLP